MTDYKELIASKIARITEINKDEIKNYIEVPQNTEMGDYAFPCFRLAKELKKSPMQIAEDIKAQFEIDEYIDIVEVVKGYLNIFIKKEA